MYMASAATMLNLKRLKVCSDRQKQMERATKKFMTKPCRDARSAAAGNLIGESQPTSSTKSV